jgi:hypothetical protein
VILLTEKQVPNGTADNRCAGIFMDENLIGTGEQDQRNGRLPGIPKSGNRIVNDRMEGITL